MKDLKLSLIIEALDRATAPLRKVGATIEAIGTRTEKLGHAFEKLKKIELLGGLITGAAVVGAAKGIWDLTSRVAELGEGFHLAAERAGLMGSRGLEDIQRLQFAVKQLGGDTGDLSTIFFRFQTHLANGIGGQKEAVKALQLLGISAQDARRLSADPVEAFLRLSDGFKAIANPAERAKLALDLFGRSGVEMLPVLLAGRGPIKGFTDQLDRAHAVMSEQDVKASRDFIHAKNEMGLAVQGLELQIARKLIPTLTDVVRKITDWLESLKPQDIDRFTNAIDGLLEQLPKLLPQLEDLITKVLGVATALTGAASKSGVLQNAMIALATVLAAQAAVSLLTTATSIARVGIAALSVIPMVLGLIPAITSLTDVMAALGLVMDANPIGLVALGVAALAGLAIVVVNNWKSVQSFFVGLFSGLAKIFAAGWKVLEGITPDWLKVLLKLGWNIDAKILGAVGAGIGSVVAPHPSAHPAPPRPNAAAGKPARADLHVHVTSDGQTHVRKISAGPGVDLTVHRGRLTA